VDIAVVDQEESEYKEAMTGSRELAGVERSSRKLLQLDGII